VKTQPSIRHQSGCASPRVSTRNVPSDHLRRVSPREHSAARPLGSSPIPSPFVAVSLVRVDATRRHTCNPAMPDADTELLWRDLYGTAGCPIHGRVVDARTAYTLISPVGGGLTTCRTPLIHSRGYPSPTLGQCDRQRISAPLSPAREWGTRAHHFDSSPYGFRLSVFDFLFLSLTTYGRIHARCLQSAHARSDDGS